MYKIYKIIDNTNNDNVYIGITKQTLKQRLAEHKCKKNCMSRDIIKNGDYRIELIEETHDKTRERYWIENNECVNKIIPGRTDKEWYNDTIDKRKEYYKEHYKNNIEKYKQRDNKEWRKNNRDKLKEYNKEYRKNNKDKLLKKQKEYHEKNRDKILAKSKKYRENNRDKILENKKEYNKIRNSWESSMGGRPCRENMSLLKIDPNLFF